jgi:hypothetical protein
MFSERERKWIKKRLKLVKKAGDGPKWWCHVVVFCPPAGKELNCQLATQLFPIKNASETVNSKHKTYAESKEAQVVYRRNTQ